MTSMQRLAAHPAIAEALAGGEVSASWARQIWEWTDVLPESARPDADAILLAAAQGGADLRDLQGLAEEIAKRTARPNRDGDDDGFRDRSLSLGVTMGGAGKLRADLTPQATAALQAVLEALGKHAGRRTCGRSGSASMTRWKKRAGGWSGRGACRSAAGSPPRSSCT